MLAVIRKLVRFDETQFIEGGKPAAPPLRLMAAAVIIRNPWAGRGYVEGLKPEIIDCAPGPDEIIIALGASTGGPPHYRIGDRYQDLKDLGHELDQPAG